MEAQNGHGAGKDRRRASGNATAGGVPTAGPVVHNDGPARPKIVHASKGIGRVEAERRVKSGEHFLRRNPTGRCRARAGKAPEVLHASGRKGSLKHDILRRGLARGSVVAVQQSLSIQATQDEDGPARGRPDDGEGNADRDAAQ